MCTYISMVTSFALLIGQIMERYGGKEEELNFDAFSVRFVEPLCCFCLQNHVNASLSISLILSRSSSNA